MLRRLTLTASLQHEDTSFGGISLSPIETEEEWALMLQTLEDNHTKNRMVLMLSTLGGSNLGEFVRGMCSRLASNPIWSTYTLKGKAFKRPLEGCAIHSVICVAARTFQPDVTVRLVNEVLDPFLRNAPHKKGGPKHKEDGNVL